MIKQLFTFISRAPQNKMRTPVSLTSRGPRPRPQSVPVEIPLVRGLLRGERRRRLQVHHPAAAARGSVQGKRELVQMNITYRAGLTIRSGQTSYWHTRIIRYKGQPIRDIVYLSEKLRDMTLWKLVFLDEIRDSWEHDEAASEMQGYLYSYYTRSVNQGVSFRVV